MADRISTLADPILCYILSFLPTKEAVATSVLSKRWKPLWLSVSTFHFDDLDVRSREKYSRFVEFVYAVILLRDLHQPVRTFRLSCSSSHCDPTNVSKWVNAASKRGIEHLELCMPLDWMFKTSSKSVSSIISCRTLVVLKLKRLSVKPFSPVDFPSLKILHLYWVCLSDYRYLTELLSGCPVLEDLEARSVYFDNSLTEGEFIRLPKLMRAHICKLCIPLDAVINVEYLRINTMENPGFKYLPVFHKLTHIELFYTFYIKDWLEVVEVLKHCPKLQVLLIDQNEFSRERKEEVRDWLYPQSVPESISLHLKTCCLSGYKGSKGEFRFASYIMQNARLLQSMTICNHVTTNQEAKLKMLQNLSLCTRKSESCKLSFK